MRAHYGRVKFKRFNVARISHHHIAHHAQALNIGVERADAVGEVFRQHGNHAARKIHAGGALDGVGVDAVAGVHVVAHIGNGHHQAEVAALFFGVNGVVKVARGFAVDGDQRQIA